MNQKQSEGLSVVLDQSNEIFKLLRMNAEIDIICLRMEERNLLIIELVEEANEEVREEIIRRLMLVRDEEDKLLNNYRVQQEEIKSSLIKLHHSKGYTSVE